MRVVTIIPARAGSKSIPRKNIMLLNDKPLISYSIGYSLNSKIVSRTIVSTDDAEIAAISRKYGADVPFIRPVELAGDFVQDYPVMKHALDYLDSVGEQYDLYVLLRPTSPLRETGLIEKALDLINSDIRASSVRAVIQASQHPYRVWNREGNYITAYVKSTCEPYNLPRQLLPAAFFQTGDIEVIRRDTLLSGSISGNYVLPLLIDNYVDIDEEKDVNAAEVILKNRGRCD